MKCPFELPLKTFYGNLSSSWLVEDATGLVLIRLGSEEEANYIVQAINSYEKYKRALGKIADSQGIASIVAEEALKEEAEKPDA